MDLDAQFRNPMLAKMSMHERKSYLIDQEIKRMGMGRYQVGQTIALLNRTYEWSGTVLTTVFSG